MDRLSAADVLVMAGLLGVGIGLPAVLAVQTHAFGIPRNDDWAYRVDLWRFVDTGRVSLAGWGAMTLVGQVLWAAPFALLFGTQAWIPGVAVALVSAAGLVAAYVLARPLLTRAGTAACVLVLLTFPGFLLNTSSFMTDVPAFSTEVICLALGAAALRGLCSPGLPEEQVGSPPAVAFGSPPAVAFGSTTWSRASGMASTGRRLGAPLFLVASLAVGLFGFSIRESVIAAPVAVLVALALRDWRHWLLYSGLGACLLAACAGIYVWSAQLPGAQHEHFGRPGIAAVKSLLAAYFTLSFILSPVLARALFRAR
ncbi:MAG TPA: hypothetical protein VED59_00700, partial [Acidimicrobiales bacterium]|nr:hypothetical protein [Acidimicrobiales bacterium]